MTAANQRIAELEAALAAERKRVAELQKYKWSYAPCMKCGAMEGMGLASKQVICPCGHSGPEIEGCGVEVDRARVDAWNLQNGSIVAELLRDQERLDFVLEEMYVYHGGAVRKREQIDAARKALVR